MMKGSGECKGPPPADLLICFPSRSHFALMPKPICSPARPSEPSLSHSNRRHHLRKPPGNMRCGSAAAPGGRASPLLWAKTKPNITDLSEPTSPKVTCAGQIKVRHKSSACKNWQTVMDEIERLHNNKKQKRGAAWIEALGFKKDVMQFLRCLRSFRPFQFRCFGSFPSADMSSDDEEDDEEEDELDRFDCAKDVRERSTNETGKKNENDDSSRTVFSKWFMILQEGKESSPGKESRRKTIKTLFDEELADEAPCVPPSNALLLMRCRSAPAKSWQEEKEEEERSESDEEKVAENTGIEYKKSAEEREEKKESLVVMAYESDFSRFSSEIVRETWVVDGIRQLISRSRSLRS